MKYDLKSWQTWCLIILINFLFSCYVEWDYPVTPRTDPCTGKIDINTTYVNPKCRRHFPPPPEPPHK
jgi:hypothetical protein